MTKRLAGNVAAILWWYVRSHGLTPIEAVGILRMASNAVVRQLLK